MWEETGGRHGSVVSNVYCSCKEQSLVLAQFPDPTLGGYIDYTIYKSNPMTYTYTKLFLKKEKKG